MKKNMRLYKMGVFFRKFILYFILLFFALLWLIPFFFLVMGSFKSTSELFQVPFRWLPKHFDFDNYINMFQQIPFLRYLKNTLIIVFFSVVGALISNSLIAYGFSRLRWPGRDKVFMIVLATMILPYQVTMIPLYLMFTKMHWVGTFLPLIVPQFFGNAFYIFLLRQFLTGVPKEITESSRIDGANEFQVFYKIIIPLAMPQLAVIFLFSFIATYSEYVITSIFLQTPGKMTLALGLQSFISDQFAAHWTLFSAAAVISSLPIMIVFMCLQRFIQNGLVAGGVKG